MKKRQKNTHKKIIVAALLACLVGVGIYVFFIRDNSMKNSDSPVEQIQEETINYAPASDEEKQEAQDNKQRIVDEQEQENQNSTGLKSVAVTIASADSNSVFASVSGVIEDGGTCTATFTKGSQTFSKSSDSIANVSNTQCGRIAPPALSAGEWQVVVSYQSSKASGTSEPMTFSVE